MIENLFHYFFNKNCFLMISNLYNEQYLCNNCLDKLKNFKQKKDHFLSTTDHLLMLMYGCI